ncbi:MAG: hypothetical protein R3A52_28065 [Polyangiales bacterium]
MSEATRRKPIARSDSAARSLRRPERHASTMGSSRDQRSAARSTSPSGVDSDTSIAPSSPARSSRSRTSTTRTSQRCAASHAGSTSGEPPYARGKRPSKRRAPASQRGSEVAAPAVAPPV